MMKKSALTVLAISMFAASSAMAAGGKEISLSGFLDNNSSVSMTMVNASFGMAIKPRLIAKVSVNTIIMDAGGSKSTILGAGVGGKYYFGEAAKSAWVPYVLADVSLNLMDTGGTSSTGLGLDGGGGVSNFITEDVSLDADARAYYQNFSGTSLSGVRVTVGVTARF